MNITIERASIDDVKDIIEIKNKSFYEDYIKYGESRGYNCSVEGITYMVQNNIAYKIQTYENKGIGRMAMAFMENQFPQAKHWSLEALADKERNIPPIHQFESSEIICTSKHNFTSFEIRF